MAQGLTATNEPCVETPDAVAAAATEPAATAEESETPEAVAQESTATAEPAEETAATAAPAESSPASAAGGLCASPLLVPLFLGFGFVFTKVNRRRQR